MNKPVAYRHWMVDDEFPEDSCWEYFDAPTGEDCKECIPLYTHPAELTDEEIAVIWANYGVPMTGMDFKKVVEAILQKANNG